ncbi:MAG TPA: hypothetical protein VHQ89_00380 [Gaiellaceae bacterium]|jgi:hypothetical protein|nr:hypothetical protein [Gaiellaceae bacterium]
MKARALILMATATLVLGGSAAYAAGGKTEQTDSAAIRAAEIRGDGLNRLYHLGRYASDSTGLNSAEARATRLRGEALNKRYHLGAYARDTWFNYAVSLGTENSGTSSGLRFTTDTLGGNGRPTQPAGYRFVTDTLAPGGGQSVGVGSDGSSFSWTTAGVATGSVICVVLLLAGGLITVRRRGRLAI